MRIKKWNCGNSANNTNFTLVKSKLKKKQTNVAF